MQLLQEAGACVERVQEVEEGQRAKEEIRLTETAPTKATTAAEATA